MNTWKRQASPDHFSAAALTLPSQEPASRRPGRWLQYTSFTSRGQPCTGTRSICIPTSAKLNFYFKLRKGKVNNYHYGVQCGDFYISIFEASF